MKNAERFLEQAVSSVLSQQDVDLELLVIDDGSTDKSREILTSFNDSRIKILSNAGTGIASAFNVGLALAEGRYICRCDADDVYEDNRLISQYQFLEANDAFGAVCGGFSMITPKGRPLRTFLKSDAEITGELRYGELRTSGCTYLMRKAILVDIGGCRDFFKTAEDIDLQLRFGEAARVWYQGVSRYVYRLHSSSITHSSPGTTNSYFDECALIFQTQRRARGYDDLQAGALPPPKSDKPGKRWHVTNHIQSQLLGEAWDQHADGHKAKAIAIGVRAIAFKVSRIEVWKSLLALVLKSSKGR